MPQDASGERAGHIPPAGPADWHDIAGVELLFESHGLTIAVWMDDPDLIPDATDAFPPGSRIVAGGRPDRIFRLGHFPAHLSPSGLDGYLLFADDAIAARGYPEGSARLLLPSLERSLEHYVAEFSATHLFIHAGVVGWQGKAIVLPGRSHTGKSTLVHGLVDAGATYYSDEFAVIDCDGLVHPYARKLSLRDGPFGPAGRVDLAPADPASQDPLPVGLVAFLTYETGKSWEVEALTGAGAILEVCDHTVAIRRRPADAFAMIGAMLNGATVIKGIRGDVDAATRAIVDLLAGDPEAR
jgi:hypothetical protein